jgi:hypothetical protein
MMSTISRFGTQDEMINELEDNIETKISIISIYKNNEDLEDYVMNVSENLGINFNSVSMSDYQLVQMDPILDQEMISTLMGSVGELDSSDSYVLKEYVCSIKDCSDGTYLESSIPSVNMEKNTIILSFESSRDSYLKFLDKILEDNKTMVLVSSSEAIDEENTNVYQMTLDIYSIKGW